MTYDEALKIVIDLAKENVEANPEMKQERDKQNKAISMVEDLRNSSWDFIA